jgi:putative SOS response-associated peptidase YedK
MSQINARSETILEKPAFKESSERRRCLIPADGFYEWVRSSKTKQPSHFGMKDDSLFAFAGIWDRWTSSEGQMVESCAILTTAPNALLKDVHDRMPVIINPNHYHAWLTAPGLKSHHFAHLLVPFDPDLMGRYPVSSLVNSAENDAPACAVEVPELTAACFGSNRENENHVNCAGFILISVFPRDLRTVPAEAGERALLPFPTGSYLDLC